MGQGGHSFICSRKGLRASLINHVYFPDCSVGKESACNAGTPIRILGQGRSPGEGKGYPLQHSWASLVAQLVKNPPAMQETWVWSLGWEDSWRRERLPTPVFWPGEFHDYIVHRLQRVGHDWMTFTSLWEGIVFGQIGCLQLRHSLKEW